MKNLLLFLACATLLVCCAHAPYGKLHNPRDYDSLTGDITEGFVWVEARVSSSHPEKSIDSGDLKARLHTKRGRDLDVYWPAELPSITTLDSGKTYSFDLIVTHWKQPKTDAARVYRITDGTTVLADLSRCELHRRPMFREVEEWIDSIVLDSNGQVRHYPHSGIFHAVCGSGMHHVVWVCPSCRDAERREIQRVERAD